MTLDRERLSRLAIRTTAYLAALGIAAGIAALSETGGLSLSAPHPFLGLLTGPALEEGISEGVDWLRRRLTRHI
jgi:hypothetical protein